MYFEPINDLNSFIVCADSAWCFKEVNLKKLVRLHHRKGIYYYEEKADNKHFFVSAVDGDHGDRFVKYPDLC